MIRSTFFVKTAIITLVLTGNLKALQAQSYIFAQLTGAPVNTTGWTMTGQAHVGNVTGTGNSEVILVPVTTQSTGSIYYATPINAVLCNKWTAEFDFRMFDGNAADGIAFWYLDVPPSGFVNGSGLGIPGSANGLKICFDTYNNCTNPPSTDMPKIEMRWGIGYSECWAQPTAQNAFGILSFIRSSAYNHAKVTYDNGNIKVFVNNTQYLSGFQALTFQGYFGFSASVGDLYDNHSIKNAVIYVDKPPSAAGNDTTICNGSTAQLGVTSDSTYTYSWTPGTGLSSTTIANPTLTLSNSLTIPINHQYIVATSKIGSPACASRDTIIVTVLPEIRKTINQTICLGQSFEGYNATGTYSDTLVSVAGCDSIRILNLTVTPPVQTTINQTICQGQSYFGYNVSGTYSDTLSTAAGCDSVRILNLTVDPPLRSVINRSICEGQSYFGYSASGTYYDTLSNANGCDSIRTLNLIVNPHTSSIIDKSICQGQSFLGYSTTGTYVDTLVNANGCDSIRTLNLSVVSRLYTFLDSTICEGQSYLGYNTTGIYVDTLRSSANCDSIVTLNLTVIPNPRPTFTISPTEGCPPLTVQFTNTSTVTAGVNFVWDLGDQTTSTQQVISHTYYTPGVYTIQLTGTNANGCTGSASQTGTVTVYPMPNAAFSSSPDPNTFGNSIISFTDLSTGVSAWNWNFGDGTGISANQNPSYSYASPGDYTVTLIISTDKGCLDTATKNITIYSLDGIYIPNAFSPNGDGLNETFGVFGLGFSNPEMTIFNRYGAVIYKTNSSQPRWNGKMNGTGKNCNSGNYIYIISLTDNFGKRQTYKGNVLLIR